jgi:hypothetical protein
MAHNSSKPSRTTRFLGVSLPPELVQRFDQERGLVNRSVWFRHILETRYGTTTNSSNNKTAQQHQKGGKEEVASSLSAASQTAESGRTPTLTGSSTTTEEPGRIPR